MKAVPLHYHVNGEGKPVFILHGLFGSSRNWQSMANKLADHARIITVDLRNHGQSAHTGSMSYPEMANDVMTLAEHLGYRKYTVIGHSMGGKVAMQMALERPTVIKQLVVLDIAPVAYSHRYGKLFTAMNNLPVATLKNRREVESQFCRTIEDPMLCLFLLQNLVRQDNGFAWRINLDALEKNMEIISGFPANLPSRYEGPGLFLGGQTSEFIRPDHLPVIEQLFPAAEVRWVENAGHMLHVEQPEKVYASLYQVISG